VAAQPLEPDTRLVIYLEDVAFPLGLIKHLYTNVDGSAGVVYLSRNQKVLSQIVHRASQNRPDSTPAWRKRSRGVNCSTLSQSCCAESSIETVARFASAGGLVRRHN